VSDADIERARRAQPTITEQDIERARKANPTPSELQLGQVPRSAGPRIDALPQPKTNVPIDLEALAKGYAEQVGNMDAAQGLASGPGLMIFVSLSMPEATLQRLLDQAARAKASVLLRGLVNGSLRDTVARVQGLIGQRQVVVQIDPQAFDRFAITRVPSFVLIRDGARPASCASGSCAPPEGFVRIAGDVSLDYALEHVQRTAPRFAKDAGGFLKRIKG
jgi:conjugal transfer pilus assembly protein TrbC